MEDRVQGIFSQPINNWNIEKKLIIQRSAWKSHQNLNFEDTAPRIFKCNINIWVGIHWTILDYNQALYFDDTGDRRHKTCPQDVLSNLEKNNKHTSKITKDTRRGTDQSFSVWSRLKVL